VIRGDLAVNETKLSNQIGGLELHPATDEELKAAGLVAGYASPIGVSNARIIADDSIQTGNNFVVGANEPGYHYTNANYPRDLAVEKVADIALAQDGSTCRQCGAKLTSTRGIEAGHVFKLGTKYSETVGATFLNREGKAQPLIMGCYGIGSGRLLACVIEQNYDEYGIIWPVSIAPFQVHIVSIGTNNPEVLAASETLYERLTQEGYEVMYDDRDESPGVKFNDADLLGIPVRLAVSRRTLKNGTFELKARWEQDRQYVPQDEIEAAIDQALQDGMSRI